jgi:hypothetical protein
MLDGTKLYKWYHMKINLSFLCMSLDNIFCENSVYKIYLIHVCCTGQNYIHSMVERYHMKINKFIIYISDEKLLRYINHKLYVYAKWERAALWPERHTIFIFCFLIG